MSYPTLVNDVKETLKIFLGEDGDAPEVANSYLSKLRSTTADQQFSSDLRERCLHIISPPDEN